MERFEDAEAFLRRALDLQSSLAQRFPEVLAYRMQTTKLEYTLARLLREQGQLESARSLLESSVVRLEEVVDVETTAWPVGWILSLHYSELVELLGEMNELEAVIAVQRRAEEHGVELSGRPPRRRGGR
ncbi:MAG: hypothetical protein JXB62_02095 [Pirellulales bacterium]|nr:hypothetical protein [Pirellulales bacterium]